MTDDFLKLCQLMGNVAEPVECPTEKDWELAEKDFGLRFPEDYKAFVSRYGTCLVMGVIHFYNPAPGALFPLTRQRYMEGGKGDLDYKTLKEVAAMSSLPEQVTFYPEKGGLLRFGSADNSILFWANTSAPPAEWRLRVTDFDEFQYFNVGFSQFMVAFIRGELNLVGMGADSYGPPSYQTFEEQQERY